MLDTVTIMPVEAFPLWREFVKEAGVWLLVRLL
jgi:hypothetical protein